MTTSIKLKTQNSKLKTRPQAREGFDQNSSGLGRNHSAGKHYNRALLLRLILQQGPLSRLSLSRLTRLSPAALTVLTGQLLEEDRLVEATEQESEDEVGRAGRPSTLLDLNPASGLALGVHIAPKAVRVGLVDLKGQVRAKVRLGPPGADAARALDEIGQAISALLQQDGLQTSQLLGVGVGAVGLVEPELGINLNALSLNWRDIPIRAELENRLGLPVLVENNARAMALGEHLFGRGFPYRAANLALVYVGAGIGGGIIINGQPYRGSAWAAGEIGHIRVVPGGEACYCGGRGCLETVASETTLVRQARNLESPFLANYPDPIDLEALVAAVQAEDEAALGLVRQAGIYLGMAVGAMAKVLNPETLVLAGPLLDGRLPLMEQVRSIIEASRGAPGGAHTILPASLGEDIGIIGGAALVLYERVFSPQN